MIVYRVDQTGRCQAVPCPSHAHVAQLLRTAADSLDHIAYYPPSGPYRFRVYLSLPQGVARSVAASLWTDPR